MRNSLITSSIRSFLLTLFGVIGVCFGFLISIILISLISSSTSDTPERLYNVSIAANAEGDRTVKSSKSPVILKLNIMGAIGTELLNMHTVRQQLIESREGDLKNDRVKAVLVHIESPGGTVTDSDGIYRALLWYKDKFNVPVYVFVDGLCASGGMYIAAAGDKVFATNSSLVGSIGVLSPPFFNVVDLMDKLGVISETVTAGKDKDTMNPFRKWKPDEDANIKKLITNFYDQFVNIIVTHRPRVNREKLIQEYGAQIFPAPEAKEIGYIDEDNSSLFEVIKLLAREISIDNDYYQVVELQRRNWYADLLRSDSPLSTGIVKHRLDIGAESDPRLLNDYLYLYRR
jgi:signal peptide peptidase SppA